MKLHDFTIPGKGDEDGKKMVVFEISADEHLGALEAAATASETDIGKAATADIRMKRRMCLREFDGMKVGKETGVEDVLGTMSAKQHGYLDAAIRHIHDVSQDEAALFLESHTVGT